MDKEQAADSDQESGCSLREGAAQDARSGGVRNRVLYMSLLPTGESAQMRGFATGVGSKADIGAGVGPPRMCGGMEGML